MKEKNTNLVENAKNNTKIAEGRSQVVGAEGAEGGSQGAGAEGAEGRSRAAGAGGVVGCRRPRGGHTQPTVLLLALEGIIKHPSFYWTFRGTVTPRHGSSKVTEGSDGGTRDGGTSEFHNHAL